MTDEKHHVDLSKIEPVFRGGDPEDDEALGTAAPATPAADAFAQTDDEPPPDPDDLDRLRRG